MRVDSQGLQCFFRNAGEGFWGGAHRTRSSAVLLIPADRRRGYGVEGKGGLPSLFLAALAGRRERRSWLSSGAGLNEVCQHVVRRGEVLGGSRSVACVWRTSGKPRGERRSTAVGAVETVAQRPKQRNSRTAPQRPFGITFAAQAAALGWKVRGRGKEGALTHLAAGHGRRDEFESEAGLCTRVGARRGQQTVEEGVLRTAAGGTGVVPKRQTSLQGSEGCVETSVRRGG